MPSWHRLLMPPLAVGPHLRGLALELFSKPIDSSHLSALGVRLQTSQPTERDGQIEQDRPDKGPGTDYYLWGRSS